MYMACTVCFASQPLGLFYLDSHPSTDKSVTHLSTDESVTVMKFLTLSFPHPSLLTHVTRSLRAQQSLHHVDQPHTPDRHTPRHIQRVCMRVCMHVFMYVCMYVKSVRETSRGSECVRMMRYRQMMSDGVAYTQHTHTDARLARV